MSPLEAAVVEWSNARQAITDDPIAADVRLHPETGEAMWRRMGSAETCLMALARKIKEPRP